MRCSRCGIDHALENIEPTFRRPDALLAVPTKEREVRIADGDDMCALRDLDGTNPRYFMRVNMPFAVEGRGEPCSWGIWVEVSRHDYEIAHALWRDPEQHHLPAFRGRIANRIRAYSASSLGLEGYVQLRSPTEVAVFTLDACDHPLSREQASGVPESTVMRWLEPILHPWLS